MRKMDASKKAAITTAVFQLTGEVGLAGLSISKVAKLAGVSPATIYIYYADKADMLSQILIGVKDVLDAGQDEAIASATAPLAQLQAFLDYMIRRWAAFPAQAIFMMAVRDNPSEIAQAGLDYSNDRGASVFELYKRLVALPEVKAVSPELMLSWTADAAINYLKPHFKHQTQPTEAEIHQMIELALDAITRHTI